MRKQSVTIVKVTIVVVRDVCYREYKESNTVTWGDLNHRVTLIIQ